MITILPGPACPEDSSTLTTDNTYCEGSPGHARQGEEPFEASDVFIAAVPS